MPGGFGALILRPDALPDANPLLFQGFGPAQWCAGLHTTEAQGVENGTDRNFVPTFLFDIYTHYRPILHRLATKPNAADRRQIERWERAAYATASAAPKRRECFSYAKHSWSDKANRDDIDL